MKRNMDLIDKILLWMEGLEQMEVRRGDVRVKFRSKEHPDAVVEAHLQFACDEGLLKARKTPAGDAFYRLGPAGFRRLERDR